MSALQFSFMPAVRAAVKARIGICGLAGSGKTYTALATARGLVGQTGRICVIDSERDSAKLYANLFGGFAHGSLPNHDVRTYIAALEAAAEAGFDAIVIDSLSHAWDGAGGALEMVNQITKRSQSKNDFMAWGDVTPLHRRLIDAMLTSPAHILATMRMKTEWVVEENAKGKQAPRRVGLKPIQRDGMEYEFDLVADIDAEHNFMPTKTRFIGLQYRGMLVDNQSCIRSPGEDFGAAIAAWISDGDASAPMHRSHTQNPAPVAPASASASSPDDERAEVLAKVKRVRDTRWEMFKGSALEVLMDAAMSRASRLGVRSALDVVYALGKLQSEHGKNPDALWKALSHADFAWTRVEDLCASAYFASATNLLAKVATIEQLGRFQQMHSDVRRGVLLGLLDLPLMDGVAQALREALSGEPFGPHRCVVPGLTKSAPAVAASSETHGYSNDDIPFDVPVDDDPPFALSTSAPTHQAAPAAQSPTLEEQARKVAQFAPWAEPFLLHGVQHAEHSDVREWLLTAMARLDAQGGAPADRILGGADYLKVKRAVAGWPEPSLRTVLGWSLDWGASSDAKELAVAELVGRMTDQQVLECWKQLGASASSQEARWALCEKWIDATSTGGKAA